MTSAITTPFFISWVEFQLLDYSFDRTWSFLAIEIPRAGRVIFPSVSSCLMIKVTSLESCWIISSSRSFSKYYHWVNSDDLSALLITAPRFPGLITHLPWPQPDFIYLCVPYPAVTTIPFYVPLIIMCSPLPPLPFLYSTSTYFPYLYLFWYISSSSTFIIPFH